MLCKRSVRSLKTKIEIGKVVFNFGSNYIIQAFSFFVNDFLYYFFCNKKTRLPFPTNDNRDNFFLFSGYISKLLEFPPQRKNLKNAT